jgi:CheY-like chemotaxis protein
MFAGRHVLVVEDDPEQSVLFARVLERAGYAVTAVADGETALAMLQRGAFDLVLSDYRLPGMKGDELIDEIKQRGVRVKTVLMSNQLGIRDTACGCCADGCYPKGDIHQLVTLVGNLLHSGSAVVS